MAAQIIQFPRKTPLEEHEFPEYWSEGDKGLYVHWTYDGYRSHQDAFDHLDMLAKMPQLPGELELDWLARRSHAVIATLPRRKGHADDIP